MLIFQEAEQEHAKKNNNKKTHQYFSDRLPPNLQTLYSQEGALLDPQGKVF